MIQSSSNKVKTYTVLPGDTWSQIAYSNNISVEELLVANERLETDSLHSGEVINIPETFNQSGEN
ncbi:LysM domain-containing protein [Enterococcus thailandicus]|nr:LysM domain-containing protein [Enterococcus thailandicus]MDA3973978.1 LysM domain-containing protein [Enterococcus thailandicus]MDA3976212.1 LysM domain-containing protein [Enterococcus thailandicus]MDA3981177.1 LysM domain-containing protein [Enterococcus thailandicus]